MNQQNYLLALSFLISLFFNVETISSQQIPAAQIKKQIENYKQDERGPYYRIKWFCKDGSIRDPKDPCPDHIGGGIQHASYKTEVTDLAKKHHVYLGNILSFYTYDEFWDQSDNHSRVKQYQLVKYLSTVDDGWIYKKGRYYRGAMQSEDEEAWGKEFYTSILANNKALSSDYYLLRESLKDIPHEGDSNTAQLIRSQSKVLADEIPDFMKIRIKIHGNPDATDIQAVEDFLKTNKSSLTQDQAAKFDELLGNMKTYYTPVSVDKLILQISQVKGTKVIEQSLIPKLKAYSASNSTGNKIKILSEIMFDTRNGLLELKDGKERLVLLDFSNVVGNDLFIQSQLWQPKSLQDLINKISELSHATVGSGLLEFWEWDAVKKHFELNANASSMTLEALQKFMVKSRGIVEWSTAMVKAVYGEEVELYTTFEPKAYQFIDDRIRSSIILDLGKSVSQLGAIVSKHSNIENDVLGIPQAAAIRGLNPGYAFGKLVVVKGAVANIEFEKDKIYAFERPPSGLKPVAGIMTVSEGNLVSHVQLLARNLGVPNAALSNDNLNSLSKYNGQEVFYAVSNKGNVIIKLAKNMSSAEKELFSKEQKNTNKVKVPVDQINLEQTDIMNLREVKADDSGKICGPKAANLGQLKSLFPDHVVEGLVIPFGIFRKHLDNNMPGEGKSYWAYLKETYAQVDAMREDGKSVKDIDSYQLKRLTTLKNSIETIELNADFVSQLESQFTKVFKSPIGKVPVFLRSDTNMEDLEEFTGAGLNLTIFNVSSKQDILEGVKRVWASPYFERSLKWRQKYLLNPEYVFPSIVIIPGVNVDYSGVVVTTGINEGSKDDITVAFSKGAGGAVDGQAAETRLITKSDSQLLSPSREPDYVYLKSSGGTETRYTTFETPILNKNNIQAIRDLVDQVRGKVPERTDPDYKGAYDLEMGFKKDKLWLFQIRPFVENKKAQSSGYLESISPKIDGNKKVNLTEKI